MTYSVAYRIVQCIRCLEFRSLLQSRQLVESIDPLGNIRFVCFCSNTGLQGCLGSWIKSGIAKASEAAARTISGPGSCNRFQSHGTKCCLIGSSRLKILQVIVPVSSTGRQGIIHKFLRDLPHKTAHGIVLGLTAKHPASGTGQCQFLLGSGDSHISQSSLFLDLQRVIGRDRHKAGE